MPRARSSRLHGQANISVPTVKAPYFADALARKNEHVEEARHDVNAFIEYCFEHYNKKTKKSLPYVQGWMHRQWQALMSIHPRLLIVAPRSHGKTSQCIARALFELGRDANHLIKIISQSDAKAVKRLSVIRSHMRDNKRLHDVFPHLQLEDASEANKHQVTVQRSARMADPSIEALGITSSASGDRATILLADDVVDRRNSITLPKVRQQIKDAWDDWVNLLGGDGGQIWYIATLWHQAALTHDLMANSEWAVAWYEITKEMGCFVRVPDGREHAATYPLWGWDPRCKVHPTPDDIVEDDPMEVSVDDIDTEPDPEEPAPDPVPEIDPEPAQTHTRCLCGPWTTPNLRRRRKELGPRKFARGFSNKPMSEGELKIDPKWIREYTEEPGDDWIWYMSVDTAESQGQQAAWTGIVIGAVNPENGHLRIWDAFHIKDKFPARVKLIVDLFIEHRFALVIIERGGGGISLIEELIETTSIPIFGMPTKTKGGHSKDERLESTTPRLANGQITFAPELNPTAGLAGLVRGDLLSELLEWGTYPTKDIADAFAHLARYCALKHPCSVDEAPDGVNAGMSLVARPARADDCMTVTLIG